MKILRFLISWQLWLSLILIGGICYGAYYYIFNQWLFQHTKYGKEIHIPDLANLPVEQAIYKLDSIGLTYEIDSVKFDSTKKSNTVISFYPMAGTTAKEGRRVFIKSNPKTWLPVKLPNLIDKSSRLAFTQLKITGLSVGDTLYEPNIARNVVLRVLYEGKEVLAGSKLPKFSKVDLVLGRGLLKDIPVPNLLNLSLEEAKYQIEQNYFEVGLIEYYGSIQDTLQAKVFFQNPFSQDVLDQGLPIDLWITDSLYTDVLDKVTLLKEQYKNIFEDGDSLEIEKYMNQSQNKSLRGLDDKTRKQLEGNEQSIKLPSRNKAKPSSSSNNDDLIIPEIE